MLYSRLSICFDYQRLTLKPVLLVCTKGYFHMCPRMYFLQTLHIDNSLYTNYENVFIEKDS